MHGPCPLRPIDELFFSLGRNGRSGVDFSFCFVENAPWLFPLTTNSSNRSSGFLPQSQMVRWLAMCMKRRRRHSAFLSPIAKSDFQVECNLSIKIGLAGLTTASSALDFLAVPVEDFGSLPMKVGPSWQSIRPLFCQKKLNSWQLDSWMFGLGRRQVASRLRPPRYSKFLLPSLPSLALMIALGKLFQSYVDLLQRSFWTRSAPSHPPSSRRSFSTYFTEWDTAPAVQTFSVSVAQATGGLMALFL